MINPLPFMTYAFVMYITPGPNNVMLTASGASFGVRRTLPHLLGICSGVAIQLLAVCAGLGALFNRWPALQPALGWAGAAYLIFLGWRMLRGGDVQARDSARPVSFIEGALFQFLNPKARVMTITALERANLFQDRDYPVLNDYRAVLGGLFRSLWALTPARCAQIFPQVAPSDLQLV